MEITINPDPNETKAACVLLPSRFESSPFALDCNAIIKPEIAASTSSRAMCENDRLIFKLL